VKNSQVEKKAQSWGKKLEYLAHRWSVLCFFFLPQPASLSKHEEPIEEEHRKVSHILHSLMVVVGSHPTVIQSTKEVSILFLAIDIPLYLQGDH
jgi:hypothetical protein